MFAVPPTVVVLDVIVDTDRLMPEVTVCQEPSPRKYVVDDGVPVAEIPATGRKPDAPEMRASARALVK